MCIYFIVLIFRLPIALKHRHGNCLAWVPTEGQHFTATCDLKVWLISYKIWDIVLTIKNHYPWSKHHNMQTYRKSKSKSQQIPSFVPGGEWSALHFGFFTPCVHLTKGCVYPKNVVIKRTLPPLWEMKSS